MPENRASRFTGVLAGALLSACTGTIDSPFGAASGGPESCTAQAALPARVRRLTGLEYQATVAALIPGSSSAAAGFPADPEPDGYPNRASALRVSGPLVQALWDAAPSLAAQAAKALTAAPPCQTTGATRDGCAEQLLSSFGAKAYRRPLASDEVQSLMAVYRVGLTGATFADGLTLALQVIVQSAGILYHTELGDEPAAPVVQLTPYEVAEELAYLTTGAPPDGPLAALAASGALSADARERETRRLLALPGARGTLGRFAAAWLEVSHVATLDRDPQTYPDWAGLRAAAQTETESFFAAAVLDDDAPFSSLFTARWSIASPALAAFYQATPGNGRVALPAAERSGVLTQASVMAAHAQQRDDSPIQRGHLVRMRLLCQYKRLAPPANLVITLPPADPHTTTRQRFAGHSSNASCQGCHQYMDPIGFGFEHYDATGHYRTTDNQQPVDATGSLIGTDVDGPFDGAVELSQKLSQSALARDCFSQAWFEYALAEDLGDSGDDASCGLKDASADFLAGRGSVKDFVARLARSDLFTARKAVH
jgi:hypothetical protein